MDDVINFIYEYANIIVLVEWSNFKFYLKLVPTINDKKHVFCVAFTQTWETLFFYLGYLSLTIHELQDSIREWEDQFHSPLSFFNSPLSGRLTTAASSTVHKSSDQTRTRNRVSNRKSLTTELRAL